MNNINKLYFSLLIKDAVHYSFSKIIPGLTGLLSVILFFRWIGAEEYGKYSIIFSFTNLLAAFSFGWINQSILRYGSTFKSRLHIIHHIYKGFILGILILTVIIIIANIFYFPIEYSMMPMILLAISIGIFNIAKAIFQSEQLPSKVIFITTVQSILMLLISILLILFYNKNSISLIIGISLAYLLPILIYLYLLNKKSLKNNKKSFKMNNKALGLFFSYGAPLSLWLAISLSLNFLDRFFIDYYFGSSLMGSYAGFSELIIRIFSIFVFPITLAVHPMLMNQWNKNKNLTKSFRFILQASIIQILICTFMLIILFFLKDYIFSLIQLMIPQLDKSLKEIMIPIFLGGFLWQLALILHKPLEIEERTLVMVGCILFSVIINIVGNFIFLPKFGIIATAYAMIFSASSYIILSIILSKSFISISRK